jgi:predicted enzyme related to lactoylglutathione lyase
VRLTATVLDTPDPRGLARFYQRLLGWPIGSDEPEWATLRPEDGGAIEVDDLDAAVALAVEAGATVAEFQPQDGVRVCLDPAGHPFCLFLPGW